MTRQCLRREGFKIAFAELSARYPGEDRKRRRAMARDLSKRTLREMRRKLNALAS